MGCWATGQMPVPLSLAFRNKLEEDRRKKPKTNPKPNNQTGVKTLLECWGSHSLVHSDLFWPIPFTLRALHKLSPANHLSAACLVTPYLPSLSKLEAEMLKSSDWHTDNVSASFRHCFAEILHAWPSSCLPNEKVLKSCKGKPGLLHLERLHLQMVSGFS